MFLKQLRGAILFKCVLKDYKSGWKVFGAQDNCLCCPYGRAGAAHPPQSLPTIFTYRMKKNVKIKNDKIKNNNVCIPQLIKHKLRLKKSTTKIKKTEKKKLMMIDLP